MSISIIQTRQVVAILDELEKGRNESMCSDSLLAPGPGVLRHMNFPTPSSL